MANYTEFGLAAYFYARDLARSWRVAEALAYGMVGLNTGLLSTETAAFGGAQESGIRRERSRHRILENAELKCGCNLRAARVPPFRSCWHSRGAPVAHSARTAVHRCPSVVARPCERSSVAQYAQTSRLIADYALRTRGQQGDFGQKDPDARCYSPSQHPR